MNKTIQILGIPMDLGQSRRGVDMGPSAVRYAGLKKRLEKLGYAVLDEGNIVVPIRDNIVDQKSVHFLPAITQTLQDVYEWAKNSVNRGNLPIFIGGDHSIAIGTIGGVTHHQESGVIWIDAHGDYNTMESSPSGNIHGMPLAALTGRGIPELVNLGREGPKVKPENIVLIGIRDLDPEERESLKESGIKVFTMRDVDELGAATVTHQTIRHLSNVENIHVSIDMDFLDPEEAPGVGTPVHGGLSYREAHLIMEILADTNRVSSIDIVEVNPILDHSNKTAKLVVELIASLLGKTIF